ncbi:MBL fold metallo-hydrolase [Paeniglutamicibacter gangotriensis]|uniref:Ribonuclease Z n=2 Tax=Paeniglutamicibacter gangotriensis TaxID=254787 RepID=M7MZK2_9MICC|nr:MBL fold metallo-hydrolase [Paeniglutamicibacter gangotriensis]EMR00482.1 ribonuclease Z [Paeniglutamicibacter gangotriensis Lz1y]KAA0975899.1 MBL fold metallo-hydrolase [Paeniglutamicibacter gangotriensis]
MKSSLVLLGTGGGPTPKSERNASCNAIVVGDATYIIDAGNGIARQMAFAELPFDSIRAMGITHHHSDHNADAGTLMHLAWCANLQGPVETFGPAPWSGIWESFLAYSATDVEIRKVDEGRPDFAAMVTAKDIVEPGVVHEDDRVRITAAWVNHPPIPALAYRVDTEDRSYVISGDTTPCESLIELARGADVLVHEVMHIPSIDPLLKRSNGARLREHLINSHTSSTAVGSIAEQAGVGQLVLSHFVPGSPAVPEEIWLADAREGFGGKIVAGRDLMVI